MPASFLDTNVILYLLSPDEAKADRAEQLLRDGPTISVQVLNEIASVGRRKLKLDWRELDEILALVRGLAQVTPLGIDTHQSGIGLARRYNFSVYDSMIVAAALEAGCGTLWSEDMQDGLRVDDRLTIRNPFTSHSTPH
ncbi:PIN domain-containing protein [Sphingomonas oryzagri]